MEEQIWAIVSIVVHHNIKERDENGRFKTNHYHWHVIKKWDYPKWIIDKHRWFFVWVQALVQSRFPKYYVSFHYCGYFPETMEKMASKRRTAISSAQAQVTKYQNKIDLLKEFCAGTLFNDYTQEPEYKRLKCKLDEKKFKLEQAIMANVEETV